MFILSDDTLDRLICTQCKKYLSVKPVKVYHNRDIKCGRCSGPSDGGVNSLYGVLAEDVLFRCVNRFDGCNQLLAYEGVEEHEKICNATRKYECPVCTNPFEGTGYEVLIHFKENHPDRLLTGHKAEFVLTVDYEESRNYLYRKNDLLFFIISSYDKNYRELTLNAKYLGASQEAAVIYQKFALFSVDEKVVHNTRQKPCSSEQTLEYFKIALTEECFPKQVVLCKLELVTGPVEQIWVLPNITGHKELQVEKKPTNSSPNTNQINPNNEIVPEQREIRSKELKGKMGEEMSSGVWRDGDRAFFVFKIDGRHYFYGQGRSDETRWFIRELLPTGQMGEITCDGHWENEMKMKSVKNVFPLFINGRPFLLVIFDHEVHSITCFIREILPGGIMGKETYLGEFEVNFKIFSAFTIKGRYYFFAHSWSDHWFIQKILPDGRLGEKTSQGKWPEFYDVVFPYSIKGKHFMYRHTSSYRYWCILELLPGGRIGEKRSDGRWIVGHKVSFPFRSGGRQYFYSQTQRVLNGKNWFIRELLPDGQMGEESDSGFWKKSNEEVFPFYMNGKQLFYGQSCFFL